MLTNLFTVSGQVLVLFCLMAVGFVCAKSGIIQYSAVGSLNNLILYVALPCSLLSAFQLDLTADTLHDFLLSLGLSAVLCFLFFLLSHIAIRDKSIHRKRLLALSAVLSNCNFMGLPLQMAVIGSVGVFYGSAYSAVTTLFMWTVGVVYLKGSLNRASLKKALLNPGFLGILMGLALFLSGTHLPALLNQGVSYLGSMAIPVPMLIIGIQLAHTDLRTALRDRTGWLAAFLRLVIFPLLGIFLMRLFGIQGNMLIAITIAASTPPAVVLAMFDDPESTLAAELISLQTLCSVVTMPLLVSLAQTLA
ncbi:hypothetical protein SAMN05216343_12033 [Oscillibacter sp. PC13]|uniref:AEC family transporter n=1 Tax=Oscillibacter sp. PC13 TaxID=1855299 RepID=UPI0008EAEA2E|nr:AEC family transporter [Oscillibacter sp. PC13]SFP99666.1 hypothetical protein SAMN05216343_12033 [Oscillibacter sp. PC13]